MTKQSYSTLMQSKFFNPAFNSAIFDGPVRIYFNQCHESLALKIYFNLQQKFAHLMAEAKEAHRQHGHNVLVMLYPSAEAFQMSFEGETAFISASELSDDQVIGVNGPFEDHRLDSVLEAVVESVNKCKSSPSPEISL